MKLSTGSLQGSARLLVVGGLLSGIACGVSCWADTLDQNEAFLKQNTAPVSAFEQNAASKRVEQAQLKLEQARRQLSAAKALVRAADAEFKAAKADQQALALRGEAQKLADASQAPLDTERKSAVGRPGVEAGKMVDLSGSKLQGWDPSSGAAVNASIKNQAVGDEVLTPFNQQNSKTGSYQPPAVP